MRTLLLLAAVFAVIFLECSIPALASDCKHWRVGGLYSHSVNSEASDLVGDAWGVTGEYSFTDALTPDERIGSGDVSISISYRRFDNATPQAQNTVDYTSFALKWRGGAGASPGCEGLYGGAGVAAALLRIQPNPLDQGPHYGVTKFQWSVFGGANFARCLYLELGYDSIPQIGDLTLQEFTVTFGGRF